ncbi:hypothetical protein AGOR_G00163770 [Albula goreensis]|uniref:Neurotransmitter-gated ion-channel transmembrane domain-containing protein n=1 Tax=Albula goreensis TaxID=1534307 RepID=A0A8T3D410_9TELE|nr:hypothetical protein AGOR_G00163770 [Albula goreensis]
MIFVTLSIVITVFVLNVHYRTPKTHTMPRWVRGVFLGLLPRVMFMTRPERDPEKLGASSSSTTRFLPPPPCTLHPAGSLHPLKHQQNQGLNSGLHPRQRLLISTELSNLNNLGDPAKASSGFLCREGRCNCCWRQRTTKLPADSGGSGLGTISGEVREAIESVKYIAENMRLQNEAKEVQDDWKYVAMVIDRIFLWVFILVCILGTAGLFLQPLLLGEDM